jgi:hypothetical protein
MSQYVSGFASRKFTYDVLAAADYKILDYRMVSSARFPQGVNILLSCK